MTDLDANKALVRRHLEEAINQRRPELWDEIMGDGFDLHHPSIAPGRANYRAAVDVLRDGFPDLREEILDVVAEGDRVAVRYVERGTHLGDFMGIPPTGKAYEKHGFALYRIADGKLAEAWFQEDDLGFQQQVFG
jgi:predicted ester cyclase